MNHKERIYNRILIPHFLGAIVTGKDILPNRISLLDVTPDITIENVTDTKSLLTMDYGDNKYTFTLNFEHREHENKQGKKIPDYIIVSIN